MDYVGGGDSFPLFFYVLRGLVTEVTQGPLVNKCPVINNRLRRCA